jgi:hypothetical protein
MRKLNINNGDRFYKLVIIKEITIKWWLRKFKCKCDCGNISNVFLMNLSSSWTKSCWCDKIKYWDEQLCKHWMAGTKIYNCWKSIKRRCNNSNTLEYKYYWARWIIYDPKWETFEWFYEDMNDWYEEYLTIDRINVDGIYCKSNCKWSTWIEQARNKRNTIFIEYKWIRKSLIDWCDIFNLKYTKAKYQIKIGVNINKLFEYEDKKQITKTNANIPSAQGKSI